MQLCKLLYTVLSTILVLYSELGAVGEVSGDVGVTNTEVVIGDIYREFTAAVQVFLSTEQVSHPHFLHLFCNFDLYTFYCRTC